MPVSVNVADEQRSSDRIRAGPEPARRALTENDHGRGVRRVVSAEIAPGEQRDSQRGEVVPIHDRPVGKEVLATRRRDAGHSDATKAQPCRSRRTVGHRRVLHAGQGSHAIQQLARNARACRRRVPRHREVHARGVHAARVEPAIHAGDTIQAPDEDACRDHEQDAERHLRRRRTRCADAACLPAPANHP